MTTAERLTAVAENVKKVYEAGKAAGGGTSPVEEKDVNFYDYDGTLLYSYTLAEAQALTELPPLPTQDTLTCLGWNWTLADIQALPAESIGADIGALYTTADGKTHCYLEIIDEKNRSVTMNFTGTIDIDWGDGTFDSGVTSPASHTYASVGLYVAKLYSASSYKIGGGTSALPFMSGSNCNTLVRFHLGANASLHSSGYGLNNQYGLETATLAKTEAYTQGLTSCSNLKHIVLGHQYFIGAQTLRYCRSLRTVCATANAFISAQGLRDCSSLKRLAVGIAARFADAYILYQNGAFQEIYFPATGNNVPGYILHTSTGLKRAVFAEGITTIGTQAFYNSRVPVLRLPASLTSIEAQAFQQCAALAYLQFKSVTPPTVANANAFSGIPATCVVEVPSASLDAYKNATNYGSIAAQMVGV